MFAARTVTFNLHFIICTSCRNVTEIQQPQRAPTHRYCYLPTPQSNMHFAVEMAQTQDVGQSTSINQSINQTINQFNCPEMQQTLDRTSREDATSANRCP